MYKPHNDTEKMYISETGKSHPTVAMDTQFKTIGKARNEENENTEI